MFIARHLRHLFVAGIVKNTLTTVFTISRITFTVVKLSVYKEVRLKVLPQIQSRRQWWQKWNLSISYGGNFWRHFVSSSFARRPRKKCARVSHEMAQSQLVLKIAHLANSMNSTPLLENISSFGVSGKHIQFRILGGRKLLVYVRTVVTAIFVMTEKD